MSIWLFVTKYRRKVFDGDAIEGLRPMLRKVCEDFDAQLVEMDGEDWTARTTTCSCWCTTRRASRSPSS
jgi:hypothetical protein